jgi:RNA polymerase sigma-70 factor (ECF subfamily)
MEGRIGATPARADSGRDALIAAMNRHADGEASAFGEVYDLLAPRLYGFFCRQTRDQSQAEDLVQQTLLQMHAARQSYIRGSDVIPWAFAIGRRLLIDTRRRRKHEVLFDSAEDAAAALDARAARDGGPDEEAAARQMAARVRSHLARLPEPKRAAYALVREEGLTVVEAADVLGITVTAVKLRAHRVYEELRAVLKSGEGKGGRRGSER